MRLHPNARHALLNHVERESPREAGGVIRDGGFHPVENLHDDPEHYWEFELEDMAGVEAVIHSHPDGSAFPSRQDLQSQIAVGCLHGIVPVADGVAGDVFFWPDRGRPYLGRPYRHGVTDCFTLIRDWYARERGIELPPQAYDWRWDLTSPQHDLFVRTRRALGWRRVEPCEAQPGDVVVFAVGGSVGNHGGVLLEDGMLLHHPSVKPFDPTSLSHRTSVNRLARLARRIVEVSRPC